MHFYPDLRFPHQRVRPYALKGDNGRHLEAVSGIIRNLSEVEVGRWFATGLTPNQR